MFSKLMEDIYAKDANNIIEIRHFLTSAKQDDRDLGAVLLYHAAQSIHAKSDYDIILKHHSKNQVQCGRPKWPRELERIKAIAKNQYGENKCAIFFCGPDAMANDISTNAQKLAEADFLFDFNKETF